LNNRQLSLRLRPLSCPQPSRTTKSRRSHRPIHTRSMKSTAKSAHAERPFTARLRLRPRLLLHRRDNPSSCIVLRAHRLSDPGGVLREHVVPSWNHAGSRKTALVPSLRQSRTALASWKSRHWFLALPRRVGSGLVAHGLTRRTRKTSASRIRLPQHPSFRIESPYRPLHLNMDQGASR
jgi:hypothetical protein